MSKTDKIRERLSQLTELCENTTDGQWWRWTVEAERASNNIGPFSVGDEHGHLDLEVDDFGNANFIAQSHQEMPALLYALEAVVKECEPDRVTHVSAEFIVDIIANELDVEEG